MSKKQDSFYFENFISCTDYACQAAHLLAAEMENFDPNNLRRSLDEIHAVEHAAERAGKGFHDAHRTGGYPTAQPEY